MSELSLLTSHSDSMSPQDSAKLSVGRKPAEVLSQGAEHSVETQILFCRGDSAV